MRSHAAKKRLARAVSILAVAMAAVSAGSAASAAEPSAPPQGRSLTSIERQADRELWRRSGAAGLQVAASYDTTMAVRYDEAFQQYLRWRSGPEFDQEVQKLRDNGSR